eukprot:6213477-Pleurochrysis_carterae.AAC.2
MRSYVVHRTLQGRAAARALRAERTLALSEHRNRSAGVRFRYCVKSASSRLSCRGDQRSRGDALVAPAHLRLDSLYALSRTTLPRRRDARAQKGFAPHRSTHSLATKGHMQRGVWRSTSNRKNSVGPEWSSETRLMSPRLHAGHLALDRFGRGTRACSSERWTQAALSSPVMRSGAGHRLERASDYWEMAEKEQILSS